MISLKPREDKFFDLFVKNSQLSYESALELREFMTDMSNPETKYGRIKELEHQGDLLVHEIFEQLNKTLITPLDREDIHAIAKALDNVTDAVEQTGSRFLMYSIDKCPDTAIAIADMIVSCTAECLELMKALRPGKPRADEPSTAHVSNVDTSNLKQPQILKKRIIEINRIEEMGDNAFRTAVRDLFIHNTAPIEVIKWKDTYENLEACLDACEELANIIGGVVMKNA